jgi:hypothetical protein
MRKLVLVTAFLCIRQTSAPASAQQYEFKEGYPTADTIQKAR